MTALYHQFSYGYFISMSMSVVCDDTVDCANCSDKSACISLEFMNIPSEVQY